MLFSFHVFVCFSGYFLWLISSSIPLWSEKKFEMISAFWNLLRLILCHNRWSTLENIPCALEDTVYSTDRGEMLWRYQINPFALMCHLKSPYSCWFSIWKPIHWSQRGVKSPDQDCTSVILSLLVHQYLLYMFRFSCVGCVNIY